MAFPEAGFTEVKSEDDHIYSCYAFLSVKTTQNEQIRDSFLLYKDHSLEVIACVMAAKIRPT